jgi:hypothetical protein
MITEILDSYEESQEDQARDVAHAEPLLKGHLQPGNGSPTTRNRWRRRAVGATCPLLLTGGAGGAMSASAAPLSPTSIPATPSVSPAPGTPSASPTATPCPKPGGMRPASAPERSGPTILLANHQPCNHHEAMATAFRWL